MVFSYYTSKGNKRSHLRVYYTTIYDHKGNSFIYQNWGIHNVLSLPFSLLCCILRILYERIYDRKSTMPVSINVGLCSNVQVYTCTKRLYCIRALGYCTGDYERGFSRAKLSYNLYIYCLYRYLYAYICCIYMGVYWNIAKRRAFCYMRAEFVLYVFKRQSWTLLEKVCHRV